MTTVDLLYVAHNRLAFTRATFQALLDHTDWDHVQRLYVLDDRSTDGTLEFLHDAARSAPVPLYLSSGRFGGPVNALNHCLDRTNAEIIAKIDNDTLVCPGWLATLLTVIDADPGLDALGMEPGFAGQVEPVGVQRASLPARWVGGQGLFRTRVFKRARPRQAERYWGMTAFQRDRMRCAWVDPDLPVFNLDHLPVEPWRSLAAGYVANGWARAWPPYSDEIASRYAGWWLQQQAMVA